MVDGSLSNEGGSLRPLFLAFAGKLLACARSHVDAEGLPKRHEHVFRFHAPKFTGPAASGSTTVFGTVEKPDFRALLFVNWQTRANEDAERCAQVHFEQGVRRDRQRFDENSQLITIPTFGPLRNALGKQLTYELYWAVADLCERYQTLEPTEEQLLEAYRLLVEEWSSRTVVWDLWAPLVNFKCEKFPLRLASGVELAALSPEEKTTLWNPNGAVGPFGEPQGLDRADMARSQFVLRDSSTTARDGHGFGPEFRSEVIRVLTALRLLKFGDIGAPLIFGVSKGLFARSGSQFIYEARVSKPGRAFELRDVDLPTFARIYESLGVGGSRMQIPLRRFNQAYGRDLPEDVVIDLTIALESCLLSDMRDELKYRLSMRGAALLADLREPIKTQTLLKTIYDIRSEIVHDGKQLADESIQKKLKRLNDPEPRVFLEACEDVTRDVLRECVLRLAAGGSLADLNSKLDIRLLSGLAPTGNKRGRSDVR